MTRIERRWARAALHAFAPAGSMGLAPGPNEVDFLACMRRMMRRSTPLAAVGLRLAVWLVAWAPLWLWGRFTTIRGLAGPRRSELLAQLLGHPSYVVRELTALLKLAASFAFLGTPSVRARSGYDRAPASTADARNDARHLHVLPPDAPAARQAAQTSEPPGAEEAS